MKASVLALAFTLGTLAAPAPAAAVRLNLGRDRVSTPPKTTRASTPPASRPRRGAVLGRMLRNEGARALGIAEWGGSQIAVGAVAAAAVGALFGEAVGAVVNLQIGAGIIGSVLSGAACIGTFEGKPWTRIVADGVRSSYREAEREVKQPRQDGPR